jgi:hypothetical protein
MPSRNRRVVTVTIPAGTLKAALLVLVTYLSTYGVTLDAAQVTGPAVPQLIYSLRQLSECLNELSVLTGYVWEIDYNNVLRMIQPGSSAAPFNVVPASDPSVVNGDIRVETVRNEYANRIIVLAGTAIRDVTDTFTGNGSNRVFTLSVPMAGFPRVSVNGVAKTVGVNGEDTQYEWTYRQSDNAMVQLTAAPPGTPTTALTGGDTLVVVYSGQHPFTKQADAVAEQVAQGLWEKVIEEPNVYDPVVAQTLADAYVTRYVTTLKRVTYFTFRSGIVPGMTQTITVPDRNLSGTFLITDVETVDVAGITFSRKVTAVGGTSVPADLARPLSRVGVEQPRCLVADGHRRPGGHHGAERARLLGRGAESRRRAESRGMAARAEPCALHRAVFIRRAGAGHDLRAQRRHHGHLPALQRHGFGRRRDLDRRGVDNADGGHVSGGNHRREDLPPRGDLVGGRRDGVWDRCFGERMRKSLSAIVAAVVLLTGVQARAQETQTITKIYTPAATDLTLAPTSDVVLNPTGKDVLPGLGYDTNLGALTKKYLTLHAAELWVETLVAQNTIATIGGRMLVGPTTVFDAGRRHWRRRRFASNTTSWSAATARTARQTTAVEFFAITSSASAHSGYFDYGVTRNLDGSGANAWTAGDAVFNTGQTGNGFIDIYSVRGVRAGTEIGPTIVGNVRTSSTYNAWSPRWAVGNLDGLYGYTGSTYGAAFGVPGGARITVDATNGIRIYGGDNDEKATIDTSGNATFDGEITVGTARNQIRNSECRVSTDDFSVFTDHGLTTSLGTGLASFRLNNEVNTCYVSIIGTPANTKVTNLFNTVFHPVATGSRYEASVYVGMHRLPTGHVDIIWYNAAAAILSISTGSVCTDASAGGTALTGYCRSTVIATAPASATMARVQFATTHDGTDTDPFLFAVRWFFGEAKPQQEDPTQWGPAGITSINNGLIETDAINTRTLQADSVTSAKIVAGTIVASDIAAGTITGTNIAATTITASNLNVSTLSAISGNMGTLTAGTITGGTIDGATIRAGSGDEVTLDSSGISLQAGTGANNKIKWSDGVTRLRAKLRHHAIRRRQHDGRASAHRHGHRRRRRGDHGEWRIRHRRRHADFAEHGQQHGHSDDLGVGLWLPEEADVLAPLQGERDALGAAGRTPTAEPHADPIRLQGRRREGCHRPQRRAALPGRAGSGEPGRARASRQRAPGHAERLPARAHQTAARRRRRAQG